MKKYYQFQELKIISKKSKKTWLSVIIPSAVLIAVISLSVLMIWIDVIPLTDSSNNIFMIENKGHIGTGFLVSDKYILTAAHVAGDIGNEVTAANETGLTRDCKVIASGYNEWKKFLVNNNMVRKGASEHDWALLEIKEPILDINPFAIGSIKDIKQGVDVFLFGHPAGQPLTVTKGVVSRIENTEVFTDGEIDPGFSGGPMVYVYDGSSPEEGVVIGIIVSSPELKSVKTAVTIDNVLKKCKEKGFAL